MADSPRRVYLVRPCVRLGYDRTVPAGAMALAVSDSGAPLLQPAGDIRAGTRAFIGVGWALGRARFARCTLSVAFRLVHARCRALHRVSIRCVIDVACCTFYCVCCATRCVLRVVHCMLSVRLHAACCTTTVCLCAKCRALRVAWCVFAHHVVCCPLRVVGCVRCVLRIMLCVARCTSPVVCALRVARHVACFGSCCPLHVANHVVCCLLHAP